MLAIERVCVFLLFGALASYAREESKSERIKYFIVPATSMSGVKVVVNSYF